jgi:hypothetical protein
MSQETEPKTGPDMLEVLDRIHRDQRQRNRQPMTEDEMAAEIERARAEDEEYESRWRQVWSHTEASGNRTVES